MTREDYLTTLGIAALIHGTDQAVRNTAKALLKRAPGSIKKNTLLPMSISPFAYDIAMESIVFAKQERLLGKVWREGYEYEIAVLMEPDYEYTVDEVFTEVLEIFIKRGCVTGEVMISVHNPETNLPLTRNVDLGNAVSRMTH